MSLRSRSRPIEERWAEFWSLYEAGRWEPETKALLERVLAPGDLFVDVGAWIGPVTLWALEVGAQVCAIEPDPVACEELRRRVPGDVEIWAGAVSTDGRPVHLETQYGWGDSMSRVAAEGLEVESWTLPEILGDRRPGLVKVDVEGYEDELLPAIAPWLAEREIPLAVSLHNALPDPTDFDGYRRVVMPTSPRNDRGRSNCVVAGV